jgi:hypothetical protein
MSHRLWVTTILLTVTLAVIVTLAFIAFFRNIIPLFIIVLVFTALAVVAFNYLVMNPFLLESAKKGARNMCETGQIIDPKLHDKLCGRLAIAPNDVEAVALHRKLKELKESPEKTEKNGHDTV